MAMLPPARWVSAEQLRRIFNDSGIWRQIRSGKLREIVKKDRHPTSPKAPEPVCTRSQMVTYLDPDGNEVARVHRYLRKDGTIGASGRPDPVKVLYQGVLYLHTSTVKSREAER